MSRFKTISGILLLSSPFVFITVVGAYQIGIGQMALVWLITIGILALSGAGVWLINED